MRISMGNETHSLALTNKKSGKYVARSVLAFLKQQVDEGTTKIRLETAPDFAAEAFCILAPFGK